MKPNEKYINSLADILPRKLLATVQSWVRNFCCNSSLIILFLFSYFQYIPQTHPSI